MADVDRSIQSTTKQAHKIAIIGSGPVGVNLARSLVRAGHNVTLSNSRGPQTLQQQEQGTGATAVDIEHAADGAGIVILAVPMSSISPLSSTFRGKLEPRCILVDTCNYYPHRDGRIERLYAGQAESSWVADNFSVPVVKAFNNIIAFDIGASALPKGSHDRVALPVASDDGEALGTVMHLVEEVGFDAYDAGPLLGSWRFQSGQPAYCTEPSLKQLPRLLAKAKEFDGGARNKHYEMNELFSKLSASYPLHLLRRAARLFAGLDTLDVQSWVAAARLVVTLLWMMVLGK